MSKFDQPLDDREAFDLFILLHRYVKAYTPDIPQTLVALAEDLVGTVADFNRDQAQELLYSFLATPGL
jgi:hypothetical protein